MLDGTLLEDPGESAETQMVPGQVPARTQRKNLPHVLDKLEQAFREEHRFNSSAQSKVG